MFTSDSQISAQARAPGRTFRVFDSSQMSARNGFEERSSLLRSLLNASEANHDSSRMRSQLDSESFFFITESHSFSRPRRQRSRSTARDTYSRTILFQQCSTHSTTSRAVETLLRVPGFPARRFVSLSRKTDASLSDFFLPFLPCRQIHKSPSRLRGKCFPQNVPLRSALRCQWR